MYIESLLLGWSVQFARASLNYCSSVPCHSDRWLLRTRKVIKEGFSPMGGV